MAKKNADNDAVAALLAKYGVSQTEFETMPDAEEKKDSPERVAFRGEAVLYALEFPLSPRITKVCKECKDPFSSYYKAVAYCSQECTIRALRAHFGINWKPNRELKKERWETRGEPRLIPLKALQAMKAIVAQAEADLGFELVLPEIRPFVPKETYFPQHDTSYSSEVDFQIRENPEPLDVSLQSLEVSLEVPLPVSSDKTETSAPVKSDEKLAASHALEDLFADLL
ncbi:hypothetical protein SEA_CASSEROLE_31 [Arthrobacter phage Casserole]|nr:hypothetical protein SEA_CASSEROLE_31 [Arthrobacter phage Casserole]